MSDARFEDGGEQPLRLIAREAPDLEVLAALAQDAVLPVTEMHHDARGREFALLLNRFRWEREGQGAPERVQSVLRVRDVMAVKTQGIDPQDREMVLSLLSLDWVPGEDGTGVLTLIFAGDGALALEVEALEVSLSDVTKPYLAPARRAPGHPD